MDRSSRFGLELNKIGQLPGRGPNWLKIEKLKKSAEQLLAEKVSREWQIKITYRHTRTERQTQGK
jgi:hypothetical protein